MTKLLWSDSGVARFWRATVLNFVGGPQLKQKIGVCQNEHRPRYTVQKYVTAIHRHKLVKIVGLRHSNGSTEGADWSGVWGGGIPLSSEGRVWSPQKIFDFVLRNVELLCIPDSGAGR